MKKQTYQEGGKKGKKYYKDRNERIRGKLVSGIDKVQDGFIKAVDENMGKLDWEKSPGSTQMMTTSSLPKAMTQVAGSMPAIAGFMGTGLASYLAKNVRSQTPEQKANAKERNKKFKSKTSTMYQKGGEKEGTTYTTKKLKKDKEGNIKKYKVVGKNLYNSDDVHSKRVEKKTRKGTTYKERSDTYAGKSSDDHKYGDKKLTRRRLKSKDDKSGMEVKRKEKITFDDGNQMTKRKQKKIRFGKNKGKIKSKTVNINRGKRTVTKRILNETDRTKLQLGGFLEAPITRLFED